MSSRICVAILVALLWQSQLLADADPLQKWEVNGVERQAWVFAPESAKTEPAPLVFVFHGHGGGMRQAAAKFRIHALWPEAIVIYPQGLNTPGKLTDPAGLKAGWQSRVGEQDDRDLKLFDAMLKWAHETYKVDDKRVYCTGHSNGGGFTYLLWGARGDTFAAMAPACALATPYIKQMKPKPVLHIAGMQDTLVKYEWQKATMESLRLLNGCEPEGKAGGNHIMVYSSAKGPPVETYIYDGGHSPPGEVWTEVVKFLKEHPAAGK